MATVDAAAPLARWLTEHVGKPVGLVTDQGATLRMVPVRVSDTCCEGRTVAEDAVAHDRPLWVRLDGVRMAQEIPPAKMALPPKGSAVLPFPGGQRA